MESQTQQEFLQREVYSVTSSSTRFQKGRVYFEQADGQILHVGDLVYPAPKQVVVCRTCSQPGHTAASCPEARCRQCDEVGHRKSECPKGPRCNNCSEYGHVKADCPTQVCHQCGEVGHKRNDCPDNPRNKRKKKRARNDDPDAIICDNCGASGHMSDFCDTRCGNCGEIGHDIHSCVAEPKEEKAPSNAKGGMDTPKDAREKPESKTSDTPKDIQEKPESKTGDTPKNIEEETPESKTGDTPKDSPRIEAQFRCSVYEPFLTWFGIRIQVSWQPENGPLPYEHRDGHVTFTHENIAGKVEHCLITEPETSEALRKLVNKDDLRMMAEELRNPDRDVTGLIHIKFVFRPDIANDASAKFMGERFYVPEPDFGPCTPEVQKIRDCFLEAPKESGLTVHFLAVDNGEWVHVIDGLNAALEKQKEASPLGEYFRDRKPNYQKGMQRARDQRPQFSMPALYSFPSFDHWAIPQYFSQVSELELQKQSVPKQTVLRIIDFGSSRVYLGVIEHTQEMQLRVDATVFVDFTGPGEDQSQKWKLHIVENEPHVPATMACGWLFRPRDGDEFMEEPKLTADYTIDSGQLTSLMDTSDALAKHRGIAVWIKEYHPHVGADRLISSLNYLSRKFSEYRTERLMLCGNSQMTIPTVNFFARDVEDCGEKAVAEAIEIAFADLSDEQQRAVQILYKLKGNQGLFQGCGGVGKTHILVCVALYQYAIKTISEKARGPVWVVSPINKQLDSLARRIDTAMATMYEKLRSKGYNPKPPVVIRRHMRETETRVWKGPSKEKRDKALGKHHEEYLDEVTSDNGKNGDARKAEDDMDVDPAENSGDNNADAESTSAQDYNADEDLVDTLAAQKLLHEAFIKHQKEGSDRRLKLKDLSEGQLMLHYAGIRVEDGNRHPIAAPGDKFGQFRAKLGSYAAGDSFSSEDQSDLTVMANQLAKELAEASDVILMTPDQACNARSYSFTPPAVVLHDEAGKAKEIQSVAVMARAKYKHVESGNDDAMKDPIPQLMFGDIFQPAATGGSDVDNPWAAQELLSNFARTLALSGTSVTLRNQHRYTPVIQDLINSILPAAQLVQAPDARQNPMAARIESLFKRMWDVDHGLVFFAKRMDDAVVESTQSRYNLESIQFITGLIFSMLREGLEGRHVGWAVPYTAQLKYASTALMALANYCAGTEQYSSLYEEVRAVQIFTIDGIQGDEKEVIILDMVVARTLKFMRNTHRMLLALTRPRAGLIVVGNVAGITEEYSGGRMRTLETAAFWKTYKFCDQRKLVINTDEEHYQKQLRNMRAPVKVVKAIQQVHSACPDHAQEPYTFEGKKWHKLSIPPFEDSDDKDDDEDMEDPIDPTGSGFPVGASGWGDGWGEGEQQGGGWGSDPTNPAASGW